MFVLVLSLSVAVVNGLLPNTWTPGAVDLNSTFEPNLGQEPPVLSKIFNDAKMKQAELEDPEQQMDSDSAISGFPADKLTSNYSHESSLETIGGNVSVPALKTINKECLIDEDCEKGFYCLCEPQHSKCVTCKQANETCSKDVECCEGQLCVFGQCIINATKGEVGTICQKQSDCDSDLCCAFSKALPFPVCDSRPNKGERCQISSNRLFPLISWNMDAEGPKEHCPCTANFKCQHHRRGALCLTESSSEEELEDAMYSEIDYLV